MSASTSVPKAQPTPKAWSHKHNQRSFAGTPVFLEECVEVCVIWSLEDAKSHKVSMPRRRFHLSWACEIHVSWILWLNGSKVKSVIDQELKGLTSSSSSSRRVTTRVTICNRIREETSLSSIGVSESSGGERELESVREREIVSERELVREGVSLCI